jgi:polyisoprenoid-binding protein YceI
MKKEKYMRQKIAFLFLLGFLTLSPGLYAGTYKIDAEHTTVSFKIRHLFSKVQGMFTKYEGSFEYDEANLGALKADATIKADSINTQVEQRDKHLRSADFFDVEKFPEITFASNKVTDAKDGKAKLHGILTIHGQKRRVVLDVEVHGVGKDPWGNVRAGLTAGTTINRKDYGLTWNKAVETGGALVGDEVEILLEVEGILQEAPAK